MPGLNSMIRWRTVRPKPKESTSYFVYSWVRGSKFGHTLACWRQRICRVLFNARFSLSVTFFSAFKSLSLPCRSSKLAVLMVRSCSRSARWSVRSWLVASLQVIFRWAIKSSNLWWWYRHFGSYGESKESRTLPENIWTIWCFGRKAHNSETRNYLPNFAELHSIQKPHVVDQKSHANGSAHSCHCEFPIQIKAYRRRSRLLSNSQRVARK